MSSMRRVLRTGGITIDIAVPQWLLLLLRMSVALWVLFVLGLILVSFAILAVRGSDGVHEGHALSLIAEDSSGTPLGYIVQLRAGTEPAKDLDKEWTLLLSSGSIHWANVVEGPDSLKPGETGTFRLTFLFEPRPEDGEPVSLRWDPGRKVNAWLMLGPEPIGP